jgi:mono/diheme cytochrome c family protein
MVACFFAQAAIVWCDVGPDPGSTVEISPLAREGQALFRSKGCQSCHALYGMGGFLGPDLTNAAERVPPERFSHLLQAGAGPMPAYRFDADARKALWAYLVAVDATGRGTPSLPPVDAGPLFARAMQRWQDQGGKIPAHVAAGAHWVADRACGACHRSFVVDATIRAPDLSLALIRLDETEVRSVLASGRGAMPPQGLNAQQTNETIAFLRWLAVHRDVLSPKRTASLPWFAYGSAQSDRAKEKSIEP